MQLETAITTLRDERPRDAEVEQVCAEIAGTVARLRAMYFARVLPVAGVIATVGYASGERVVDLVDAIFCGCVRGVL